MWIRRSAGARVAALLAALVFGSCLPALALAQTPIPATFFGINPIRSDDFPPLSFGTEGHPPFVWTWVEASRGAFDFTAYDAFVNDAKARGLYDPATNTVHMAITLGLTPNWAVSDQTTCTHAAPGPLKQCSAPPDSMSDWTDLLNHLIDHYNGVTMPHIQYYELWNEANFDSLWWTPPAGDTTNATLVNMARLAYPIVHRDPVSQLLSPSVAGKIGDQATWMAAYLKDGGAQYADVAVYHGYMGANASSSFPMPEEEGSYGSTPTRITRMRAVFDTCGLMGKPMMMTEGSWGKFNVTDPDLQTEWLSRYMLLQAGEYATAHLQMASWFCWGDSTFGWGDLETGAGAPTAAALAYSAVYQWVVGATIAAPFSGGANNTWIGSLTRPGGYVGKVVWNTQGAAFYTPPGSNYNRWRDLAGNTHAIAAGDSVPIGPKPVIVEKGVVTNAVPALAPMPLRITPNITRAAARIQFGAALDGPGRVEIVDVLGRVVRTLPVAAHSASVVWDGRARDGLLVPGGVYFVRLVCANVVELGRVTVSR
ncbi:MAG TPA: hypothetical protein VFI79_10480 [Gemmatimonadales bacterium]|nr:hypothetical protein [Gemmatimonadales bacterium]